MAVQLFKSFVQTFDKVQSVTALASPLLAALAGFPQAMQRTAALSCLVDAMQALSSLSDDDGAKDFAVKVADAVKASTAKEALDENKAAGYKLLTKLSLSFGVDVLGAVTTVVKAKKPSSSQATMLKVQLDCLCSLISIMEELPGDIVPHLTRIVEAGAKKSTAQVRACVFGIQ